MLKHAVNAVVHRKIVKLNICRDNDTNNQKIKFHMKIKYLCLILFLALVSCTGNPQDEQEILNTRSISVSDSSKNDDGLSIFISEVDTLWLTNDTVAL